MPSRERRPPVSYREPSYEARPGTSGSLSRSNAVRYPSRPSSSRGDSRPAPSRDSYYPGVDLGSLAGSSMPYNDRFHLPSDGSAHRPRTDYATEERRPTASRGHNACQDNDRRPSRSHSHREISSPYPSHDARPILPDRYTRPVYLSQLSHETRPRFSDRHAEPAYPSRHHEEHRPSRRDHESRRREESSHHGRVSPLGTSRFETIHRVSSRDRRDSHHGLGISGSHGTRARDWPEEQFSRAGLRWPLQGPHRRGSTSSSVRTRTSLLDEYEDYDGFEYRRGAEREPYGRS